MAVANNKIVYNNQTLIDLTGDDVSEKDVRSGITFHLPDGTIAEGELEVDDDMKILYFELDPNDTPPKDPGDVVVVDNWYYEDGTVPTEGDVLDDMPKVIAVWISGSNSYYVFTPYYYATYTNYPNLEFRCDKDGIYRLHYNNSQQRWELILDSVIGSDSYEEWTFEVDDGNGGTTQVVKAINCRDITS